MGRSARKEGSAAEWVSPLELQPWAGNPRRNDGAPVDHVAESIQRFGFGAPIVARRENGEIIAGHTRWKAARKLGLEKVPVRYVDLDEREAHLLALADNRLVELTPWDDRQLADALDGYSLQEAELAGWDSEALEKLAGSIDDFGPLEIEEVDTTAVAGEFWVAARGPIGEQPEILERLKEALAGIEGVTVDVGSVGR